MKNKFYFLLSILFVLFIFRNWFLPVNLSSGDFIYYFENSIQDVYPFSIWDSRHLGMGGSVLPTMWLEGPFALTLQSLKLIPWVVYERFFWFWPFLVFSFLSSFMLARRIISRSPFQYLVPVIYSTNTYALLLVGGGQMGVALAYAFAPFVINSYISLTDFDSPKIGRSLRSGLLLAALVVFDIRLSYIISVLVFLLYFYSQIVVKKSGGIFQFKKLVHYFVIPFTVVLLIHSFWILPLLVFRSNPIELVGEEITGIASVKFFSFSQLETAFSLLHPNWPDNIFGKVSFLPGVFLIVPFMAFFSGYFLSKKNKSTFLIIFFLLVSLLGVFFGKGANDPAGWLYLFFFQYIPGFNMFRDPTKWYLLIAISYSILIPFTLEQVSFLKFVKKFKKVGPFLFIGFIIVWLFLIRDVITSEKGTYGSHPVPYEYRNFADMLAKDKEFGRTLWMPIRHRYGYSSEVHPAVNFAEVSKKEKFEKFFLRADFITQLQRKSIKYIVVPFDSDAEIFTKDGKLNNSERQRYENILNSTNKLQKIEEVGGITVYKVPSPMPHFYVIGRGKVQYRKISPTKYLLSLSQLSVNDMLVFSENFDDKWEFRIKREGIRSERWESVNSFKLKSHGSLEAELVYLPQRWVYMGLLITCVTLLISIYIIRKR